MKNVLCFITKKQVPLENAHQGGTLPAPVFALIQSEYPAFSTKDYISTDQLKRFQIQYLTKTIEQNGAVLEHPEKEVVQAISDLKIISENVEDNMDENLTLGQKVADRIAIFGGSWAFILSFLAFIIIWILINIAFLANQGFDPYPFILLNLFLSCIAAIQAPIIMMSQNRQNEKDRLRSEHDYKINLKAELEIKMLHEKMDYLISYHNQQTIEIQEAIARLEKK